ncbi:hypothetical protein WME75_16620 [Sorangium sp. So ce1014]|uniref:hypothetical protein n=1 Tax=Sorangium sp. So ce1014 TaxID=3133326 RepID=UPI003F610A66
MLTAIMLDGFRCFAEPTRVTFGALTLLAGVNSAGKSSTIYALLALMQSEQQVGDAGHLRLSGEWVDIGSFKQALNYSREERRFAIGVSSRIEDFETDFVLTLGEPEGSGYGTAKIERGEACVDDEEFSFAPASGTGASMYYWWRNQHRMDSDWDNVLDLLLQLLSGPWVQNLEVDDGPCPTDTDPSCLEAPDWLVEVLLTGAHHGLSCGRPSWILSYGPNPYLDKPIYRAERGERQIELRNLRTAHEAAEAEAALSRPNVTTTLSVLEQAVLHTERVRILDTARSSAKRWELDCDAAILFEAIRALDAYARALDTGLPRESAAERYKLACCVDMSQEKAQTLKKPTLGKQRELHVPGFAEKQLFDMHAKPGNRTRVHVFACKEPRDEKDAEKGDQSVVYIGHCGEHLDLY